MTIPAKNCLITIFSTNFYHTLVVCYRAHYSTSYLARSVQDCNLLRQWGHKTLDRTQKRVGHGRERHGRMEIIRGKMGMVASYIDGMWHSFLLHLPWLPMGDKAYDNVDMYHSNIQLTRWVRVNGQVHAGKEDKQVKQHYYVLITEIILMKVYNMTIPAKHCQ